MSSIRGSISHKPCNFQLAEMCNFRLELTAVPQGRHFGTDIVPLVQDIRRPDALRDAAFGTLLGSGRAKPIAAFRPIISTVSFSSIEDYPVDLIRTVLRSIVPGGPGFHASSVHVH